MLTGNGARLLSASFDELPETGIDPIENFTVKLMNSEARTIEVFDKDMVIQLLTASLTTMIRHMSLDMK